MARERAIQDSVVIVTGAARGVGLATARRLSAEGARVAMADLDVDLAMRAAASIRGAQAFHVDVAQRESFASLLEEVSREFGLVDVLINNAAVLALGPFADAREEVIARQVEVNLIGVINGMQLALPGMLDRGCGHIINISSPVGKYATPGESVYAATKHGVVALSEVVRAELRRDPIDISMVFMGPVRDTDLAAGMRATRGIRLLDMEDVVDAIVNVVRHPRFDVWVPRYSRWLEVTQHLLPRMVREWTQRQFGLHAIATDINWSERAPYEERTFGLADSFAASLVAERIAELDR
jgi:NAD(P)-dependent dehydrogenase (short-subunit alcohol dehydrogenase family)